MPGPANSAAALPGQHEDAGADDAADAEQHEVQRAQRFLELAVRMLGMHLLDRLPGKQLPETTSCHEVPPPRMPLKEPAISEADVSQPRARRQPALD